MTKLIIQIPCWNEEVTLASTLADLPREVPGVSKIEILVIDDGSTDQTADVATRLGVDHVVRHKAHRGLAAAFRTGIMACLARGADVIVNTDADNQYPGRYVAPLVAAVVRGDADMVIGDRQVGTITHFSRTKRFLQRLGTATVRHAAGVQVSDATSGFRAFSREAALHLHVLTDYTYTLETIIQAGKKQFILAEVPITTNPPTRRSRLITSQTNYVVKSAFTILQLFVLYEPFKTFLIVSAPLFLVGSALYVRYAVLALLGFAGRGAHIQSVVVASAALVIAFLVLLIGLVGHLIRENRRLQEEVLYYEKRRAVEVPAAGRNTLGVELGERDAVSH